MADALDRYYSAQPKAQSDGGDALDRFYTGQPDLPTVLSGQWDMLKRTPAMAKQTLIGAGSGALSTIAGAAEAATDTGSAPSSYIGKWVSDKAKAVRQWAKGVHDDQESIAGPMQDAEQYGEYLLPMGEIKPAVLPGAKALLKRAALGGLQDGAKAGVVAGAQSGGDPRVTGITAGVGALLGGTGRAVGEGVGQFWDGMAGLTQDDPVSTSGKSRMDATAYGDRKGIPVTPGIRTGNEALRQITKATNSSPLLVQASENANAANLGYEGAANDIQARLPGTQLSKVNAGEDAFGHMDTTRRIAKGVEDSNWGKFRQNTAGMTVDRDRNAMKAQLQPIYDRMLAEIGHESNPAFQALHEIMTTGDTKMVGTPPSTTNTQTVRTTLPPPQSTSPITVDTQMNGTTTPQGGTPVSFGSGTFQQHIAPGVKVTDVTKNSPGNLRTVQVGGPTTVDLETALRDLSNLGKASDTTKATHSADQALFKKMYGEYNDAVTSTIQAHPNGNQLLTDLNDARLSTRKRVAADNIMNTWGKMDLRADGTRGWVFDPAAVYQSLTQRGEHSIPLLRDLRMISPKSVDDVGSSFFNELVQRMSSQGSNPSFTGAAGADAAWRSLGPQTQRMLYGPMADEMSTFFTLGKYLAQNVNPSGTGPVVGFIKAFQKLWQNPVGESSHMAMELALGRYLHTAGPGGGPLPFMGNLNKTTLAQFPWAVRFMGQTARGVNAVAPKIGMPLAGVAGVGSQHLLRSDQSK